MPQMKLLPPRKKDWKKGKFQVGLFIRTETGGVVEAVWDDAPPGMQAKVIELLHSGSLGDPSHKREKEPKSNGKTKEHAPETVS